MAGRQAGLKPRRYEPRRYELRPTRPRSCAELKLRPTHPSVVSVVSVVSVFDVSAPENMHFMHEKADTLQKFRLSVASNSNFLANCASSRA